MPVKAPRKKDNYILRLYVADNTPQSAIAERNLKQLCEEHLAGRYQLEIIDLLKHPERAKLDDVLVVPTLVRKLPVPIRRFIGTLSDAHRVIIDLDQCLSALENPFASSVGEKHV